MAAMCPCSDLSLIPSRRAIRLSEYPPMSSLLMDSQSDGMTSPAAFAACSGTNGNYFARSQERSKAPFRKRTIPPAH